MGTNPFVSLHVETIEMQCCWHKMQTNCPYRRGNGNGLICSGGVWEEPWNQKRALQTIQTIERHWYQTDGAAAGAGHLTDAIEGPDDAFDDDNDDEEGRPRKQLKPSVNKVCAHIACSAQTVCLVEQLQIVRDNYRGRTDQFRIKVSTYL